MVRRQLAFLFLFLFLFSSLSLAAQPDTRFIEEYDKKKPATPAPKTSSPDPKSENDILDPNYWLGYLHDTGDIVLSPLHWQLKDYLVAGVVAGGTVGLFFADQGIRNSAQDHRSSALDSTSNVFSIIGEGYVLAPALGVWYGSGLLFHDEKAKRTALLGLESFALTGLFNTSIKVITQRHRPGDGISSDDWYGGGFSLHSNRLSFPSGHTSSAFAVATVVATEYQDVWFIPPLSYALATLVGLSRIEKDKHWASDVFVGAALGYFTAKGVVARHPKKKKTEVAILPYHDRAETGLRVSCRF